MNNEQFDNWFNSVFETTLTEDQTNILADDLVSMLDAAYHGIKTAKTAPSKGEKIIEYRFCCIGCAIRKGTGPIFVFASSGTRVQACPSLGYSCHFWGSTEGSQKTPQLNHETTIHNLKSYSWANIQEIGWRLLNTIHVCMVISEQVIATWDIHFQEGYWLQWKQAYRSPCWSSSSGDLSYEFLINELRHKLWEDRSTRKMRFAKTSPWFSWSCQNPTHLDLVFTNVYGTLYKCSDAQFNHNVMHWNTQHQSVNSKSGAKILDFLKACVGFVHYLIRKNLCCPIYIPS